MQHRKAVTLDTKMWPWDNPRVDKLEENVNGIQKDISGIKELMENPNGQKREEDDNGGWGRRTKATREGDMAVGEAARGRTRG